MKVIVTGAAGMLGSDLCPILLKDGFKVYPTDLYTEDTPFDILDIRKENEVNGYMRKVKPELIIHLAAETDVDKCEAKMEHAFLTNTKGTENIALACRLLDIPMVFISTGAVFDGKKKELYRESDIPNPIDIYGRTKLKAEDLIKKLLSKYFIFRAGWMTGGGKKDKKFVGKIINILGHKKEISAVTDKRGSPTFTKDFSLNLLRVIKTEHYGLFHMVNEGGGCTRFDIAVKIVEYLGKKDIVIKPVTSEVFPLLALRGDSEAMENHKLELLDLNYMPRWEDSLKRYISEIVE